MAQTTVSAPTHEAVCFLKPDLEANGERELAALEVRALLNRPLFDESGCNSDFINLGEITLDEVRLLQARLAFTDQILFAGISYPCSQSTLERASSELSTLNTEIMISLKTRRRNEYLTHGFHKYKAKFFPRLARALINVVCGGGHRSLLDPFVGSGTAIVEAYTMGVSATGIDFDPLAVFISEQKIKALQNVVKEPTFPDRIERIADSSPTSVSQEHLFHQMKRGCVYRLPEYIRTKLPESTASLIEREVAVVRDHIRTLANSEEISIARLALSHAVATKLNLRWMGTGDNRFSLSVRSASICSLYSRQLRLMARNLMKAAPLVCSNGARAAVLEGNALSLPFEDGSFDGIVTSPPYLPASSGRETYLRSRGPSLIALELMSEDEILDREAMMMGSVLNNAEPDASLPREVCDLVDWMRPQRARGPKAVATARYFLELRNALKEMSRVLTRGGRLALVVASAHVFYDLATKATVRVVDMPSLIQKITSEAQIPLVLRKVVHMDLAKMDYAARPASKGNYSEAIIFFERA
jgi:tRNA G10  N-methylase Trm11